MDVENQLPVRSSIGGCAMGTSGRAVRAMSASNTCCSITSASARVHSSAGPGASMSTLSPIASNTACGVVAVVSV